MLDLRRRVRADPSSIVFAQLAEELRRAGAHQEAIEVCRTGLARHPAYLSARVTLGRALLELDRLDEAHDTLEIVVATAPDNLAAIRALAEIHQRRGENSEALGYYQRALELARHDPELRETVVRLERELAPAEAAESGTSVEDLFDFDRLVRQLGAETPPEVAAIDAVAMGFGPATVQPPPAPEFPEDPADEFARLESSLRRRDAHGFAREASAPTELESHDASVLRELERWLEAIGADAR